MGVDFVSGTEENAFAVLVPALRGEERPSRVFGSQVEKVFVLGFVLQPSVDEAGENKFGQRSIEIRLEFSGQCSAVKGEGLIGSNGEDGFVALDEFAFDG